MSQAASQSEETAANSGSGGETYFIYPGRELEAMAQAANYHRWIVRIFMPYPGPARCRGGRRSRLVLRINTRTS